MFFFVILVRCDLFGSRFCEFFINTFVVLFSTGYFFVHIYVFGNERKCLLGGMTCLFMKLSKIIDNLCIQIDNDTDTEVHNERG